MSEAEHEDFAQMSAGGSGGKRIHTIGLKMKKPHTNTPVPIAELNSVLTETRTANIAVIIAI
jgi:hypothetical protein